MDEKETTSTLPFHAINEFMRDDFRMEIIRKTLLALPSLSSEFREPIDRLTNRFIQVQGFRNSAKAPVGMRLKPSAETFKKNPEFARSIVSTWAAINPELIKQVSDLLVERNWQPMSAGNLNDQPGFLTTWPSGESFETVIIAFQEKYPDSTQNPDEVSLMVVWVSGRLPYNSTNDQDNPEAI